MSFLFTDYNLPFFLLRSLLIIYFMDSTIMDVFMHRYRSSTFLLLNYFIRKYSQKIAGSDGKGNLTKMCVVACFRLKGLYPFLLLPAMCEPTGGVLLKLQWASESAEELVKKQSNRTETNSQIQRTWLAEGREVGGMQSLIL